MYTKILAQGAKFGSAATGLDNPGVEAAYTVFKSILKGVRFSIFIYFLYLIELSFLCKISRESFCKD